MSVSYTDFQGEIAGLVLKFPFYGTATINAELNALATSLATDTTTHSKLVEHPPAPLAVGGAGLTTFTNLANLMINKAKGGNLPNPSIAAAIAGTTGAVSKPGVISPPSISASASPPIVGTVLTATTGTWAATPTSYTYAWYRSGVVIAAATAATYTLVSADTGGKQLTSVVTAVNATGSTVAPPSNAVYVP